MSNCRPRILAALPLLASLPPVGFVRAEVPRRCAAFEVMDLPFRVCVDAAAPGGGFWFWGPGQPSGIGGFLDDEGTEPFFILSTDYEPGVSLGGYPPTPRYFRLTLRWDSAGSCPGALVAEVCGAEPVLLRLGPEAAPKARSCGEWVPLLSALAFPAEAARR